MRRILAPVAITAAIAGGAGAMAFAPGFAGAQSAGTTTQPDDVTVEGDGRARPLADALATLVENGTLTQAQADEVLAALRDALPRPRRHRPAAKVELSAAAEYLGMDLAEVHAALHDGRTLASLVDGDETADGLVAAMVATAGEQLDRAVGDGKLTEERAAEVRSHLEERLTTFVHEPRRRPDPRHGPREPVRGPLRAGGEGGI